MRMMERSGICDLIGRDRFYWSVEQALIEGRPLPVPGCTREPALAEADELLTAGF
jgi:hypothetical protein